PPYQGAATLAVGDRAGCWRSPPYRRTVGSRPLQPGNSWSCPRAAAAPAGGCPLKAAPCRLLPLQATAPLQGGLGCSRPPPCREIVYPCIPNPNGEDERRQASSSLAVSTRWISIAKLFQYNLATLAQREGEE
ncbi:hypothetical protein BHM03_00049849, partial [Ensete ventricosum]